MTARYDVTRLPVLAGVSPDEWRRRMGMSGQTYRNYCRYGLNEESADRFAVRTGMHPFTVWPEMCDDVIRETTGLSAVQVVHAMVSCLECGRPVETVDVQVSADGTGGTVVSVCPTGHRNRMSITVEVD